MSARLRARSRPAPPGSLSLLQREGSSSESSCASNVRLNFSEGASLIAQLEKNPPAMQDTPVRFLHQEDPLEKGKATHSSILGLPCGSAGKVSARNAGDLGSIPGLGRSPGEGKGYPLQYSGLENSMDCIVHRVTKNQTQLSNFHFHLTSLNLGFLICDKGEAGPA